MPDQKQTRFYETITSFSPLSAEAFSLFSAIAAIRSVRKGENILSEGKPCKWIFFIEKGYLRTFIIKDGIEINIDFSFEGSFVTNLKSLRDGNPSEVIIKAGEDSIIYCIEKSELLALYDQSPQVESLGRNILEYLLTEQENHSKLFKIASPAERYKYITEHNPQLIQRVSITQLASYLGVTRETITRIRKLR